MVAKTLCHQSQWHGRCMSRLQSLPPMCFITRCRTVTGIIVFKCVLSASRPMSRPDRVKNARFMADGQAGPRGGDSSSIVPIIHRREMYLALLSVLRVCWPEKVDCRCLTPFLILEHTSTHTPFQRESGQVFAAPPSHFRRVGA